ncbi:hypothetical protein GY45DRAFT_1322087 [Cubamyces sp. BRFM 1775]|nr:hypothetical protein GY45DRAFT_1322087 [Cubamyces sp. BRFM 1775]
MGQSGYLVICNATSYDWTRTHHHSYQMNDWDFPAVIPAYTSVGVRVEFDEDIFKIPSDDSGEADYKIDFPLYSQKLEFAVKFRDLFLRVFNRASDAAPGWQLDLGWRNNGTVVFVLAGAPEYLYYMSQ